MGNDDAQRGGGEAPGQAPVEGVHSGFTIEQVEVVPPGFTTEQTSSDVGVVPEAMETHPSRGTALTPLGRMLFELQGPEVPPTASDSAPNLATPVASRRRLAVEVTFHPEAWKRIEQIRETGLYGRTPAQVVEHLALRGLRYVLGAR